VLFRLVWFGFGCTYYGFVLLTPAIFPTASGEGYNYLQITLSSCAEVVGTALTYWSIDSLGRKWCQILGYGLSGLCMLPLGREGLGYGWTLCFAMAARAFLMGGSSATWVQTPELYPTLMRGTGHSLASTMARVGGFLTPFWAAASGMPLPVVAGLYGGLNVAVALCCCMLPSHDALAMEAGPAGAVVAVTVAGEQRAGVLSPLQLGSSSGDATVLADGGAMPTVAAL
jgi:hypothetical protein